MLFILFILYTLFLVKTIIMTHLQEQLTMQKYILIHILVQMLLLNKELYVLMGNIMMELDVK